MTWAEFKKQMEDAGITDDMKMWYIDVSFDGKLCVDLKTEDNIGFSVYN